MSPQVVPATALPATAGIDVGTTHLKVALVAWEECASGLASHVLVTAQAPTPATADALCADTSGLSQSVPWRKPGSPGS